MNTLWRKSLVYAAGRGISAGIGFVLLPVLTRLMTPAQYGAWQVAEFWAMMGMFAIRMGVEQALFKFAVLNSERKGVFVFNSLLVVTGASVLLLTLGFFLKDFLAKIFLSGDFPSSLVILIFLWSVADSYFSVIASVFQSEERAGYFVAMDISRGALAYGLAIALLVAGFGVKGVIAARVAATFAVVVATVPAVISRITLQFDRAALSQMIKYGFPLTINLFVVRIFTSSDRWFVAKLANFSDAGAYSAAAKVASIVAMAVVPVRYAWSARLFHLHREGKLRAELPHLWRQFAGVFGIVALAVILFGREIFHLFVGPGYESGVSVVPVLAAAYFLDSLILIADAGIYITGRTIFVPIFTATAALVNIFLDIIWIPRMGIIGAAYAVLAGFVALLFLSWRTGQFFLPVRIPYAKIVLVFAAVGVGVFAAQRFESFFARLIFAVVLGGLVFWGTELDRHLRGGIAKWKNSRRK